MAEKVTSIRLQVVDGAKTKAELKAVGDEGDRALRRVADAGEPASKGLMALDAAAADVRGRIEGLAGGLGPVGAAMAALGPAGLVAAAGMAALTGGLAIGLREYAEAERLNLRLGAVLKATGYAAGLTGEDLDELADSIENSTMQTAEGVKAAAAILATFKSVAGDTFGQATRLAADMAAVFGGDMTSAATQLGKALEDPVEGISALRRVGVTFTQSQQDAIKALVETGQQAKAQGMILEALRDQVGGAAAGEAGGLSGSFKKASDQVGNFFENLVRVTGVSAGTKAALEAIAEGLARVNERSGAVIQRDEDLGRKTVENSRAILEVEERIARVRETPGGGQFLPQLQKRLDALKAEEAALRKVAAAESDRISAANEGPAKAARDAAAERFLTIQKDIGKQLEKNATTAERVADAEKLGAALRARLDAERDGGNISKIDYEREAARIEEATRRSVEAIRKPEAEAASRLRESVDKVIADLKGSVDLFENKRGDFIREAVQRLPQGATDADIEAVKRYAGALYDKQQAEKEAKKAADEHKKAMEDGRKTTEDNRTAAEEYAATVGDLREQLAKGAITQETFNRAVAKAGRELAVSQQKALEASRDFADGAARGFQTYADAATNAAKNAQTAIGNNLQTLEDHLTEFVSTGTTDWKAMVDSMIADWVRLVIRMSVTGPLASMFAGALGASVPIPTLHTGGVVGAGLGGSRSLPPEVFVPAPRYHGGGIAGLRPDERAAVLQTGERVLSRAETRAYDRGRQGGAVIYNIDARGADRAAIARLEQKLEGIRRNPGQFSAEVNRANERGTRPRTLTWDDR